ncbi:NUDIX hydrolase domain-like protein [Lipomyces arxii]|uniref:NUDIX hydrolase domain-like protein n=1 Tax=Lipomyces arxii TaxID=56418 RepID=UPI0034CDD5A6
MEPVVRSMVAREGREKQRYSTSGARLVSGVIALSADKTKVLMVTSTARQDKFVLPKGGFETDEPTPEDAAMREAWEEAGIIGKITKSLGVIDDLRPPKLFVPNTNGGDIIPPRAEYHFFEMDLEKEENVWPESNRRVRKWFTYSEAIRDLKSRPELIEALNRSSIIKS